MNLGNFMELTLIIFGILEMTLTSLCINMDELPCGRTQGSGSSTKKKSKIKNSEKRNKKFNNFSKN